MIFYGNKIEKQELEPLVSRKILPHSENIMLVEVHFKKGGIGKPHTHENYEQVSYVLEGSFECTIGEEIKIIKKGDGFIANKNVIHGLKALEDSIVLDTFTPIRKDFL
ncbi:MAG: cupin domain-containing protein [Treponema sp.]|jgi:quercetin dioxygenase-like cupin family protein|nr:cupin domain-containing protein [Treponema sp.]